MALAVDPLRQHLLEQLLPAWAEHGRDRAHGGWHVFLEPDLSPSPTSDFRRLVVQTRQLFSMSVAHQLGADTWALQAAHDSFEHLLRTFRDPVNGGFYFTTEPDGSPRQPEKDTYAHAFVLLSFATYFAATGEAEALRHADDTLAVLDAHLAEPRTGGFAEGAKADWSPLEPAPERRQNPHMHLLEAFLALHDATGRSDYLERARAMIQLFRAHFYDPATATIGEYFDDGWAPAAGERGGHVEPGHHFEWIWLLHQYARASGETDVLDAADAIYRKTLAHGMTAGGLAAIDGMDRAGKPRDTDQRAWPQTELLKTLAVRAEWGDEDARARLDAVWAHCVDTRVDRATGMWREKLDVNGACVERRYFAATVYHVVLAVTELLRVLQSRSAVDAPAPRRVDTQPFDDQQPGTSGLRKKVRVFEQPHYLENFVQAAFDALPREPRPVLVLGGDGRYGNRDAAQRIVKMALANGFERVVVGRAALLSTPALSNLIRRREAAGGIVLSASHNPGGPAGDFGIKVNTADGAPAPDRVTGAIRARTLALREYAILDTADFDLDRLGHHRVGERRVEVVDPVADYQSEMERLFDFDLLRDAFASGRISLHHDAMHAVAGPYASRIFEVALGAPAGSVVHAVPLEDFGGGHPDPNRVHAKSLIERMARPDAPMLGSATDGDADRNMITGPGFFVAPSDSLAILAEHAEQVPQYAAGLVGVARSMPTSRAVDRVARARGIDLYEVPTGWKFFGSLLGAGRVRLCGEESFGTGGDHVREKDGVWAVLFWLSLLARLGRSVEQIARDHWASFGRCYYCRHDYEGLDSDCAESLFEDLESRAPDLAGTRFADRSVESADVFAYTDPVDGSSVSHQGVRIHFADDARIVVRLSGTGSSGATLRIYLETYAAVGVDHALAPEAATASLAEIAREVTRVAHFTGREDPDIVT